MCRLNGIKKADDALMRRALFILLGMSRSLHSCIAFCNGLEQGLVHFVR